MSIFSIFGKKSDCIHHWYYVGKNNESTTITGKPKWEDVVLFCPKCESEDTVTEERWSQLQEIHKVREEYRKTVLEAAENNATLLSCSSIMIPPDVIEKPSLTRRNPRPVTAKL